VQDQATFEEQRVTHPGGEDRHATYDQEERETTREQQASDRETKRATRTQDPGRRFLPFRLGPDLLGGS
jgi:hypothetical protein